MAAAEIGVAMCGIGGLLEVLGVLLLFDRALLAAGNLLLVTGVFLVLQRRAILFFFQWKKAKATTLFFLGIFLVIMGSIWTYLGFVLEAMGAYYLFRWGLLVTSRLQRLRRDFLPALVSFAARLPVLGSLVAALGGDGGGSLPV